LKHLDIILGKLEELEFTVNLKKCKFARPNIKYLGHIIGSGKHQPDPNKLEAIRKLKSPTTKTQLRSVLGLCNYYRDYIKNYSEVVYVVSQNQNTECMFSKYSLINLVHRRYLATHMFLLETSHTHILLAYSYNHS